MLPDEPIDEEREEALAQDYDTPFRPAAPGPASDMAGVDAQLDDTHPDTDTGIQKEELYDEGVSGAAESAEPNDNSSVVDYTPPDDPQAA